jgi:AraC family transcriptional regulator
MDYQIIEKPSFKVAGKAIRVPTKDGENFRIIPEFWRDTVSDGTFARLKDLAAKSAFLEGVTLGICSDFAGDMSEFTYMIAAEAPVEGAPDGMVEKSIPAATYAVFESVGPMPDAIQNVWIGIWSEFFPSAPYGHAEGHDLEIYPPGDPMAADYRSEVGCRW